MAVGGIGVMVVGAVSGVECLGGEKLGRSSARNLATA